MPFGALAPLPLRLGGSAEEGWLAEQHTRLALDVAAAHAVMPIAVMVVTVAATPTIDWFICRGGSTIGDVVATYSGGSLKVDFGARYYSEDSLSWHSWAPTHGMASRSTAAAVGLSVAGDQVSFVASSGDVCTIVVYGSVEERHAGDYGAELHKSNSKQEGDMPYAYKWLLEQDAEMGTAFSTSPDSLVRFEAIAGARCFALGQRIAEASSCQRGSPASADGMLGYWCTVLGIPQGQPDWMCRRLASAKMILRSGATDEVLNDAITEVMGAAFVELVRYPGTLESPPDPTWWKYGTPGPDILALDSDGCWLSQRCHVVVSLVEVAGRSSEAIARVANNELRSILSGALPGVATWNWAFNVGDSGFVLGTDRLGRDAL